MTVSIFPCNVNQVIRFIPVDHILNNEPHGITERYWVPDLKSGEPAVVRLLNPAKRRTEPQIVCERLKHVGTPDSGDQGDAAGGYPGSPPAINASREGAPKLRI